MCVCDCRAEQTVDQRRECRVTLWEPHRSANPLLSSQSRSHKLTRRGDRAERRGEDTDMLMSI